MSRASLFLAASCFTLVACQPAADAPQDLVAETPPPVEDVAAMEEVSAAPEGVSETLETATMDEADVHDHEEDHDHNDHEHGESHDDHVESEEAHDHDHSDEHDHGDDHDHGAGEAHVHGVSEMAASLDGNTLSVSLEGALANFDLDESIRTLDDASPFASGTVEIIGGDCAQNGSDISIRPIGDHGNLTIDLTYTCQAPASLEAIEVTGFQSYQGFETVNAVYLTGSGQSAETLTASDTRLDLN